VTAELDDGPWLIFFARGAAYMTTRTLIAAILLWYNVLSISIWFGGTIYQMLVIVPLWSASPPESVRLFFQGTEYIRTVRHFFGPLTMALRTVPLVLGLIAGWHLTHRFWLLLPVVCTAVAVVMTLAYIYPINSVLFDQAGGNLSGADIQALVRRWIIADRVRLGIMTVGYLSLLRALSLPFPKSSAPSSPRPCRGNVEHSRSLKIRSRSSFSRAAGWRRHLALFDGHPIPYIEPSGSFTTTSVNRGKTDHVGR
jgi:hypothetical protein